MAGRFLRSVRTSQPQQPLGADNDARFAFNAAIGRVNLANNVFASNTGGAWVTTPQGKALSTAGGSYPIWAHNARYNTPERSVVVAFVPREGLGAASRRVWSDYNFTTYSFVLTFDPTGIGLFVHNGTSGASALWTTTPTVGKPMVLVGTAGNGFVKLFADGKEVASAAFTGSLRSVSDGIALGGNPAGADPQPFNAAFAMAVQLPKCISVSQAISYSINPWQVFAPLERAIWVPVSAAGGSTGTSATTNANDTSSASGTTTVVGTSAKTNANDTSSASGTVGGSSTGTSATTNAPDTSSAFGWAGVVSGTAAVTNANDTSTAEGIGGPRNTGAGRARRKRRVQVEIDGRIHEVTSEEEARELLEEVKREAEAAAELAISRAAKAQKRPQRKVLADARKSLQLPEITAGEYQSMVDSMLGEIQNLYQSALDTIEISALLRRKEREEEDDEEVLMLLL